MTHGTGARAILGIDAAWTARQPSGIALAVETRGGWRCAAVAPSYDDFLRLADGVPVDWAARACLGAVPPVQALLAAVRRIAPASRIEVAAVDMPLAAGRITGRRACDDALSRVYGGRGLGVHTPSVERPGALSDGMHRAFAERGFRLATTAPRRGTRHLLEVYPHTAVMALTGSGYRVPYKLARARRYWPDATPRQRRERLLAEWRRILVTLRRVIAGIDLPLPADPPERASGMKRYEDALDALVCAWVGIEFLEGRAIAFGDATAAIWSPAEPRAPDAPGAARA